MKEDKGKHYSEKDLEKFFLGELSSDKEELVRKWFAHPGDEKEKDIILENAFDKSVKPTHNPGEKAYRMLESFKDGIEVKRPETQLMPVKRTSTWIRASRVAAVLLPFMIVLGAVFVYFNNIDRNTVKVVAAGSVPGPATVIEAGEKGREVKLPCGSLVVLNKDAVISYYEDTYEQERETELSGEAYFMVAKKDGAPFTVNTEALKVSVLGTVFNINAGKDNIETVVSLYQGAVSVETEGSSSVLAPHHEFRWNSDTKSFDTREISSGMPAWMMSGNTVTLQEIFMLIEDQYSVTIVAAPAVNTQQLYLFVMDDNAGLEETLSLLCEINGNMKYEIKNDTVFLKTL